MAIPDAVRQNFETMLRAARNGDLGILETKDAKTGEARYVIAALAVQPDRSTLMTPFGHMCSGNPHEEYMDPTEAMEKDKRR